MAAHREFYGPADEDRLVPGDRQQCEHFAQRLAAMAPSSRGRVEVAVQLVFGRPARPDEIADLTAYADKHGLANLCRVLFNANEFLFVN